MTIREYYDFEDAAEYKHELIDGYAVAMSGGTERSSTVENNIAGELRTRLKGRECRPHGSNLKVRIPRTLRCRYPDALVIYGPTEFDADNPRQHTITNPTLCVEILSPSTEQDDRTSKFDDYRSIPSFREYVLIAQAEPRIETYFRADDGHWQFEVKTALSDVVRLKSIGIDLPLAEVYAGVTFDPIAPNPAPADTAAVGADLPPTPPPVGG